MRTYNNLHMDTNTYVYTPAYTDLKAFAFADVTQALRDSETSAEFIRWFNEHVMPTLTVDANGSVVRDTPAYKDANKTYKAAGQDALRQSDWTIGRCIDGTYVTLTAAQCLCDKDEFKALEGALKAAVKEGRDALNNLVDKRWSRLLGKASGGAKAPESWNDFVKRITEDAIKKSKSLNKKGTPCMDAAKVEALMAALYIVEPSHDL